jgi:hypothetical protein
MKKNRFLSLLKLTDVKLIDEQTLDMIQGYNHIMSTNEIYVTYFDKYYRVILKDSLIDVFEINLRKYKQLFVYNDDIKLFYKSYKSYTDNCTFLIDKNILIKKNDIEIEYVNYNIDLDYNFKNKIIKHDFIREYLK